MPWKAIGLWINWICYPEDVVAVKSLFALLCVTFTAFTAFSLLADVDDVDLYELNICSPTYDSHFPIDFSWIVERYDFDWVEQYIDEYYGTYYKHWERYLNSKQRELAGRFGLTNIFVKPNFRRYENTKVVFSKRIWDDRLVIRYLAPVRDVWDFELLIAMKPHRFVTLITKGHMNGEESIAIVVNRPFGSESENRDAARQARRLLGEAKRLMKFK